MRRRTESGRAPVTIAGFLVCFALVSVVRGALAVLPPECPTKATLTAVQGGGTIELKQGTAVRIPYGVDYVYRRAIPGAANVWITIRGGTDRPERTMVAGVVNESNGCRELVLPVFTRGAPVALVERVARRPSSADRSLLADAIQALRRAFVDSLYSGYVVQGVLAADLGARLSLLFDSLPGAQPLRNLHLVTLTEGTLRSVSLADTVRALFVASAVRSPRDGILSIGNVYQEAQNLARLLVSWFINGQTCSSAPAQPTATPQDSQALRALADKLLPLERGTSRQDIYALYAQRVLPLPSAQVDSLPGLLRRACGGISNDNIERYRRNSIGLIRDPFAPLFEVTREALALIEEAYGVSVEDYLGATTTLQRFAQLDVLNAYFFSSRDVRVLATFGIYPGQLRYGAERDPTQPDDRLVFHVGYSVGQVVEGDTSSASDQTVFVVGVTVRMNGAVGLAFGRSLTPRGARSWYVSLSGDLASLPFLQNLFARIPPS